MTACAGLTSLYRNVFVVYSFQPQIPWCLEFSYLCESLIAFCVLSTKFLSINDAYLHYFPFEIISKYKPKKENWTKNKKFTFCKYGIVIGKPKTLHKIICNFNQKGISIKIKDIKDNLSEKMKKYEMLISN